MANPYIRHVLRIFDLAKSPEAEAVEPRIALALEGAPKALEFLSVGHHFDDGPSDLDNGPGHLNDRSDDFSDGSDDFSDGSDDFDSHLPGAPQQSAGAGAGADADGKDFDVELTNSPGEHVRLQKDV